MGYKYLHRRNGVYYFWMRIPKTCVKQFGYSIIRKSLKTTSKVEAQRIGHILMLSFNDLFEKVEAGMLTDEKIHEIVSKTFRKALAGFEAIRVGKPHKASEVEEFIANFPKEKLKELLRQNHTDPVMPLADFLLKEENEPIEKESFQYKKFLRELLKMFAEVCPIEKERSEGNFMNEYDKQSSYTHTSQKELQYTEKVKPTLKISELFSKYAKEKETGGNWGPKTKLDNNAYSKTLIEITGDIDVGQIDNQLMLEYRDILVQLPPNREKSPKFRGKSIQEILKVPNIKPMSLKTVNCHLSFVSSLQKWGVQHGFLDKNYAESLTFKRNSKPIASDVLYF